MAVPTRVTVFTEAVNIVGVASTKLASPINSSVPTEPTSSTESNVTFAVPVTLEKVLSVVVNS